MDGTEKTLSILDVGHGNCAVLINGEGVHIIDAGPGSALLEFLQQEGITKIDAVLISHSDKDHIAGLVALITSGEFEIGRVRLNSDAIKDSDLWDDLAFALSNAHQEGKIDFRPSLTVADTGAYDLGDVQVQILAPDLYLATRGPGSTDRHGRELDSNSMSAVIRLIHDGNPFALLTGDIDDVGLENMVERGVDCRASILIFPHHGGRPGGGDMATFARKLSALVSPHTVVFSIGRGGRFSNPQPEIVTAVRASLPGVRIACTQLSKHCARDLPSADPVHLTTRYAKGRRARSCCGGTFVVDLNAPVGLLLPVLEDHQKFIVSNAESAMCLQPITAPGSE